MPHPPYSSLTYPLACAPFLPLQLNNNKFRWLGGRVGGDTALQEHHTVGWCGLAMGSRVCQASRSAASKSFFTRFGFRNPCSGHP